MVECGGTTTSSFATAQLHPTNGGFNPVLTILALAFRTAEHIASVT